MADNVTENIKGTAKEAAGKATGSDELAREGEAQQKRAQKAEEAERLEREAEEKRMEEARHELDQRARE